jgi:putative sigma-54 modulation protein
MIGYVKKCSFRSFSSFWSNTVQVNVSARHGHLKPEDQAIIVEKVEKVRRLFDRINAIEVTVDLEHLDKPTVEINVSAEHSNDFVATTQSTTVISALDLTIGKVEQQIRKHKEKVTEHKATGVKHAGGSEV